MSELQLLIGEKIRQIRKQRGLSQDDLAELTNINRPRITNIERGKVNMTLNTLETILEALDTHISDLFDFSDLANDNAIKQKRHLLEIHLSQLKERELDEIDYIYQTTQNFLKTLDNKIQK